MSVNIVKVCSRCKAEKPGSEFSPNKQGRLGLASRCRECIREIGRMERAANPEKYQKISRDWYAANTDRAKEIKDQWAKKNPDNGRRRGKTWRDRNPERVAELFKASAERNRESILAARKVRRARDKHVPSIRISNSVRSRVYESLKRSWKSYSTFNLLGYSRDELMSHLEERFLPGMTWENYGPVWHIDHIVPLSAHNFVSSEDIDFKKAWALSNLQPLWASDNMSKGAKLSEPFQPSFAFAA